jgi:hypothetical protein
LSWHGDIVGQYQPLHAFRVRTYAWDAENRLVRLTYPGQQGLLFLKKKKQKDFSNTRRG